MREIAGRARELGALVHLDACQGPRWVPPPLDRVDLASFSGHKLGAGRGGLLFARPGLRLEPLTFGGPQEWARRAGREDVGAALAMATALEVCGSRRKRMAEAAAPPAEGLEDLLERLGGRRTGTAPRLPNFATAAFNNTWYASATLDPTKASRHPAALPAQAGRSTPRTSCWPWASTSTTPLAASG